MRIVNRAEFLAMPAGTVFNKYKPSYFEAPCIKGETWNHCQDFLVQYLDCLECQPGTQTMDTYNRLDVGEEIPLDFDCLGRDGCFDEDQLFAVWSDADVEALIDRIVRRRDT